MTPQPVVSDRAAWTLADWAKHLAADFRRWETTTAARGPRDEALAWHILAALADNDELTELVDRIRAGTQEVVW